MTERPNLRVKTLRIARMLVRNELDRVVSNWLEPHTVDNLINISKPHNRITHGIRQQLDNHVIMRLQARLSTAHLWKLG